MNNKNLNNCLSSENWDANGLDYHKKDVLIEVHSAFELNKQDVNQIVELISKKYNFTPYPILIKVDKSLIGGVKVVFDAKVIDSSIKTKLNKLIDNFKERD